MIFVLLLVVGWVAGNAAVLGVAAALEHRRSVRESQALGHAAPAPVVPIGAR
jgi:hypothetical protein